MSRPAPAGARLRVLAGAGALAIDAALGEPPARLHPVVGIGSLLAALRRRSRAGTPGGQLAEGAAGLALVLGASALAGVAAQRALARLPRSGALAGEAAALSALLALRGLREAVQGVGEALDAGDLDAARARAARDLVSRDTTELDASELAAAAIQSLAENLSDSVVAPLLAYLAGGLPAAAAYRALNTADAVWGYRTPDLLYRGRAAARADDVGNLIPARLAALYLAARSPRPREAWRIALRDHALAPSPNGGWPMAAMAGGLGVRLAKRGSYDFNAEAPAPTPADIARALRVVGG